MWDNLSAEEELKMWQQGRNAPIDEKALQRQYQNKINNAQGQHFEREILAGCRTYSGVGIADIDKTPEPFRVMKKERNGVFKGRFTALAQPDFQGTLAGGQSIVFEAKQTSKDRIIRSVLTDTQMRILESHYKLGAFAAVCVHIRDKFYFLPWSVWRDMKAIYGHQYVTHLEVEEYEIKFDGAVRFLEYKNESTQREIEAINAAWRIHNKDNG